jgi:hypothetical protein
MSGRAYLPGLLLIAVLVMLTAAVAEDGPLPARPPTAPVARVLRWLPPDTEAIAVANGPIELKKSLHDIDGDQNAADRLSLSETGAIFACSRVSLLQDGKLLKRFRGLKLSAIVDGRRRFHVDEDDDLGHCDGCQILLAAEGEAPKLGRTFQAWIAAGQSTIQVDDQTAVLVEEKDEDELIRALFANPAPGVLLCASTPSYLREVIGRMRDEAQQSAFPADRPEWKVVDCRAPFWGIRRFHPDGRDGDVTSPYHKRAAVKDPKAVGFAFWCGADKRKGTELVYLSNSRNAVGLLATESFEKDDFRIDRIAENAFRIQKIEEDDDERLDDLVEILLMTGFLRAL